MTIGAASVGNTFKRDKLRIFYIRYEDSANLYDFNSRFNDHVKTL